MAGCVAGLAQRWCFYCWPDDDGDRQPPEEGDIGVVRSTGSCYLITSIKPSRRKAAGWYTVHVEGLGVDAAGLDDDGTFGLARLSHADYEAIRMIEAAERLDGQNAVG